MITTVVGFSSVQAFSRVWLCDPMNGSMPGLPVHHQLPEFTQTHANGVSDAIQPSHPRSSPSPSPSNPSQHQGLFQWVGSLRQVAKLLELQLQPSVLPMNIQGWFPLGWTGWISLQSKGFSRVFSNTTVQKHQFCILYGPALTIVPEPWADHSFDYTDLCQQSDVYAFQHTV